MTPTIPTTAQPIQPTPAGASTPANPETLADWAFRCFVQVVDAEPGLSVSDVEQLHTWTRGLMADPSARDVAPVAQWLDAHYPMLWKRHVAQGQALDASALRTEWQALIQPHPLGAALRAALAPLLARCAQPRTRWLNRLSPKPTVGTTPSTARQAKLAALWQDLDRTAPVGNALPAHAPTLTSTPTSTPNPAPAHTPAPPLPPAALPTATRWQLRCVAITNETPDMRTFVFRRLDGDIPPYAPGQFMTLELHTQAHGRLFRSYTLSSSPSRPHTVAISVKRLPGGRGSNWLHDHVQPGWEVQARGASGHFTCGRSGEPSRLLLLGAGSGMTPMMSMLRWLTDTGSTADVALVQSARTEADVVFQAEWGPLARHAAGPRAWHVVLGSGSPGGRRLDLAALLACVPDVAQRTAYLCGPQPYLDSVKALLAQAGVPPEHILEEQFAAAAPTPSAASAPSAAATTSAVKAAAANNAGATTGTKGAAGAASTANGTVATANRVAVHFARANRTVQAAPGDCLLEVAEAHGIDLPSACRSGQCGTCWTPLISGEVQVGDQASTTHGDGTEVAACISRLCHGPVSLDC